MREPRRLGPPARTRIRRDADHDSARRMVWTACECGLRWHRVPGQALRPPAPPPRPRSDGPRVREPAGYGGGGPRCADVDRALLAAVPRGLRGDALFLPDDPAYRASEGSAAPRRHVSHRRLHGGRLYIARLVQRSLHRASGRDADGIPGPRPQRARWRARLRRQGPDPPEPQTSQDRRRLGGAGLALVAWMS